jgi:hypothetical protein
MQLRLTYLNGPNQGHSIQVEGGRTVVLGRSARTDVQVPDERASRRHCAIKLEPERVLIADLRSGNGTFLNGQPIVQPIPLKDGDRILIGSTEIGVGLPVAAAPPPVFPPPEPPAPPVPCNECGTPLSPYDLELGEKWKNKRFCLRCHPPPEIPGVVLERRLGEGAMGAVFKGRDPRNGSELAIKVLKLRGAIQPEDRARFVREASTSAALVHPNVVAVLGRGETPAGILFIAMEFVRGEPLKAKIDRGPLMLTEALSISRQIASALEHAREKHIVHRDVKPENILVTNEGVAKLTDFGLAKSILMSGLSGLTRPGEGMGTLPYMPPEQIENAVEADHRSDIYSLGATLYHMLTGKRPFSAASNMDFFMKILHEDPPPILQFRSDVPFPVIRLVERCMKKQPQERWQTAGEIVTQLDMLLGSADSRQTAE